MHAFNILVDNFVLNFWYFRVKYSTAKLGDTETDFSITFAYFMMNMTTHNICIGYLYS